MPPGLVIVPVRFEYRDPRAVARRVVGFFEVAVGGEPPVVADGEVSVARLLRGKQELDRVGAIRATAADESGAVACAENQLSAGRDRIGAGVTPVIDDVRAVA